MTAVTATLPSHQLDAFVIYDALRAPGRGRLDPITVILRDSGGKGKVIVECYGVAWSYFFGSIGGQTLREFLAQCDQFYLADKLQSHRRDMTKKARKSEESYLQDIAAAIIASLKDSTK